MKSLRSADLGREIELLGEAMRNWFQDVRCRNDRLRELRRVMMAGWLDGCWMV